MALKKILMLKESLVEGGKEVEEEKEVKNKKELGTFQLFKKIPKGSVPIEALVKASMSAMEHVVVSSGTQKKGDDKNEERKIPLKD